MLNENDRQYTEHTITAVRAFPGESVPAWDIDYRNIGTWTHRLFDENGVGVAPRVGETLRLYGVGIGQPVRGAAVNGRVYCYRTAKAQEIAEVEYRWKCRGAKL